MHVSFSTVPPAISTMSLAANAEAVRAACGSDPRSNLYDESDVKARRRELRRMPEGAVFINVGRGQQVNEEELIGEQQV